MRVSVAALSLVAVLSLAACSLLPGSGGLTGKAWQWTGSTTQVPASQSVVPNPENYTIQFNADGTYNARADCNQMNGAYTTSGTNGLTILPGPMTRAFCGEESLDLTFVGSLTATSTYSIANGLLTLAAADGSTMSFR
jgi:heat shock protein HslJ